MLQMRRIATLLCIFASVATLGTSPGRAQGLSHPTAPESLQGKAPGSGQVQARLPVPAHSQASSSSTTPASKGASSNEYHIGPRDLVAVRVFEEPQLNVDVRVNEDGTIRLPLVGNVSAEGLTENQLAARLKKILESSLLQRASVSVEVLEYRSRPISVIGAVKKPGNLDVSGRLTLLEALTDAGGLAENHGNTVNVLRRAENGLTDQVSISLDELLVKANPDVNIPIFANDLINVPAAVDLTVYCLGEVATPGAYSFHSTERVTLLAVIARAGGLTDRASKKILIKRPLPDGKAKEIVAHYKRIISGEEPDIELEQGDVVVVKESFF